VVEDIFVEKIESGRLLVRNKVNLMTIFSQRLTEFSSDHTTAPEGRIAHNADFHTESPAGRERFVAQQQIRPKKIPPNLNCLPTL